MHASAALPVEALLLASLLLRLPRARPLAVLQSVSSSAEALAALAGIAGCLVVLPAYLLLAGGVACDQNSKTSWNLPSVAHGERSKRPTRAKVLATRCEAAVEQATRETSIEGASQQPPASMLIRAG